MADILTIASGISGVLGGIAGILDSRKKSQPQLSPRDSMMSQAQGARDVAATYGFNPLTAYMYGQTNGSSGLATSGAPPLASFDMISQGFRDVNDVVSGDAERRKQQENLKLDLAKLEIERLQAGKAADAVGGVSRLGNRAVGVGSTRTAAPRFLGNVNGRPITVTREDGRTGVTAGSVDVVPDEGWSDAEIAEQRYGEFGGSVYGLGVAVADAFSTVTDHAKRKRQEYIDQHGMTPREAAVGAVTEFFQPAQDALSTAYKNEQERKKRSAERMKKKGLF